MFSGIQMLSRLYDVTIDLTTIFGLPVKGALIHMQSMMLRLTATCALRGDLPSRGDFIETISWRLSFTQRDSSEGVAFFKKQRKTKD